MIDQLRQRDEQLVHHRAQQAPAARGPEALGATLPEVLERAREATQQSVWEAEEARARADLIEVERAHRAGRLVSARASLSDAMRDAIVRGALDLDHNEAVRTVVRWRHRGADWPLLVLEGGTGSGKSVAASWWVANRPTGGHVVTATAAAAAWDSSTVTAQERRELMSDCAALVLDDVGTEIPRHMEAMGAALRELLECRQGLRTIITTNLTREGWSKRYPDGRLASRMARAAWVNAHGPDHRRQP